MTSKKKDIQAASAVFKSDQAAKEYIAAYDKVLQAWPVPYTEKEIPTSYGTSHVIICGKESAPAMVLLHGMDASSTMWYPNVKELAEHYRIYAIDFIREPGKSSSEKPPGAHEEIADWYEQTFSALGLNELHLVGASRGGWMSLLIARHTKKKVRSVVLLSPAQTFQIVKPKKKILKSFFFILSPKKKRFNTMMREMSSDPGKIDAAFKDQLFLAVSNKKKQTDLARMQPFTDAELKAVTVPVFVMIGDTDAINDRKSNERAEKTLTDVKTEVIANAGHFLSLDQAEQINGKILDFLRDK